MPLKTYHCSKRELQGEAWHGRGWVWVLLLSGTPRHSACRGPAARWRLLRGSVCSVTLCCWLASGQCSSPCFWPQLTWPTTPTFLNGPPSCSCFLKWPEQPCSYLSIGFSINLEIWTSHSLKSPFWCQMLRGFFNFLFIFFWGDFFKTLSKL